jgi:hypothetical protein
MPLVSPTALYLAVAAIITLIAVYFAHHSTTVPAIEAATTRLSPVGIGPRSLCTVSVLLVINAPLCDAAHRRL